MNPFYVCAFALAATGAIIVVRQTRAEIAILASATAGVLIFVYVLQGFVPFLEFIKNMAQDSGVAHYFAILLKALGISLCCRVSSDICRDSGENALASKVELAGKMGIVVLSLPLVKQLLEIAKDMM